MQRSNYWGELIVRLREEQNVSQRELCIQAKINRQTLRNLEQGHSKIPLDILERALNSLGYELEAMHIEGRR